LSSPLTLKRHALISCSKTTPSTPEAVAAEELAGVAKAMPAQAAAAGHLGPTGSNLNFAGVHELPATFVRVSQSRPASGWLVRDEGIHVMFGGSATMQILTGAVA